MSEMTAAEEAASWLRFAEKGYRAKYGSVPLETRINLARAWIDLARIEAGNDNKENDDNG
jgi:hypothetical protein